MTAARASEPVLPGHLDHGKLKRLLGYSLAQASIPTNTIFKKQIGEVFQLNKLEFTTLMLLSSNAEATPKRLTMALNVPAPNLTLLLDRLEKRELLTRIRSEADKRMQWVCLSEQGKALVADMERASEAMEQQLLGHLTVAERAMLFELLTKVAAHRRG
jgi:MarR family transcriptional regulator for hemolysin